MHNIKNFFLWIFISTCIFSCSPKNISTKYYEQHKEHLNKIEQQYKALYQTNPFTLAFVNNGFTQVSFELFTDSLTYIYDFNIKETRLVDTLKHFNLNADSILSLMYLMKDIKCTWVNNLDYYNDDKKTSLIFISIKPLALHSLFSNKKYYILTYFSKPQYFNANGMLYSNKALQKIQKINGEIFWRINDKVCYTISSKFR